MPSYVLLTEARRHDRMGARLLSLNPGSIVAMDRAYNDYRLFADWTAAGIFFVTRLKDNADYEVIEERRVPKNSSIQSDQVIRLVGTVAEKKCRDLLRRVVVWDEANQRRIVLLSNHLEFGATTIAAIYQDRGEIELFFKTLKQHLKVKTFVGTSENALRIQIWTALIALLLLKWLHYQSHLSWSFSNLATLLRLNLFTYRDMLEWLKDPSGRSRCRRQAQEPYNCIFRCPYLDSLKTFNGTKGRPGPEKPPSDRPSPREQQETQDGAGLSWTAVKDLNGVGESLILGYV